MNCANHPERPVAAFCQNCGKPLCTECVRSVAGQVYDEACLAAKLHGTQTGTWAPVEAAVAPPADPVQRAYGWSLQQSASPVLAGWLGFIPGVAAMYNGQFIKALVHVVVFIFLIGLTEHFGLAGLLIAAWVLYQVFDGVQTAVARRDGLPLPDPFGLNDLGQRVGMPAAQGVPVSPVPPVSYVPPVSPVPPTGWGAPGAAADVGAVPPPPPPPAGYTAVPPTLPVAPAYVPAARPEPIGAIVLIAVGVLFLLSTLGVFHADWVGRGWPVIIILIGVVLLVRRLRAVPPAGGAL